ncbi:Hypothetical Protein FCC1311_034202 [Hondaea fermentalgiana]|uniref:Uncharacterized protein n=1 Tax=Hondaea fermentalgiana TaxID=2315210 RepID=A0A2R5G827_9STRA|nr:Hypothetical Protein FCC1311_034202 [Hondaea fermentalgiana]|eukprot:GBG27197.1 Hypothetical Protein FCC1311_034202 [Hondaea fermentalgiana]
MRRQPVGFADSVVDADDEDVPPPPPPPLPPTGPSMRPAPFERARSEVVRPSMRESSRSLLGLPPGSEKKTRKSLLRARPKSTLEEMGDVAHVGSRRILQPVTTPADKEYVDFTVVPLLLRSGITYQQATDFGAHLMSLETQEAILSIMENAESLIDELTRKGVPVSERIQLKLETDRLWKSKRQSVASMGKDNRKSFVYYRADERTQSLRAEVRLRKSMAVQEPATARPGSRSTRPRSQFPGGRTELRPGSETDITPEQLERLASIINASRSGQK